MALIPLNFEYLTGLRRPFLVSARLTGSWNAQGLASEQWSSTTMESFTAEDGCPAATEPLAVPAVPLAFLALVKSPARPRGCAAGMPRGAARRRRCFT